MSFPSIAPSRFGPLARKALRYRTKAEDNLKPADVTNKPEQPKEKPATSSPATPTASPEPTEVPINNSSANVLPQIPTQPEQPVAQMPGETGEPPVPPDNPPEGEWPGDNDPEWQQFLAHNPEPEETEAPEPSALQPIQISFYESIKESPDDSTPCLIYADWLEENNQLDLAQAIRLDVYVYDTRTKKQFTSEIKRNVLQAEQEVHKLERAHPEWFAPWGNSIAGINGYSSGPNGSRATMSKGMLWATSSASRFENLLDTYGPERLLANVQNLHLVDNVDSSRLSRIFSNSNWLKYVAQLNLSSNPIGGFHWHSSPPIIPMIANNENSRNLQVLNLADTDATASDIESLADSPYLNNLRVLDLRGNGTYSYNNESTDDYNAGYNAWIYALASPNAFPNMQKLILREIGFTFAQRRALRRRYGNALVIDE